MSVPAISPAVAIGPAAILRPLPAAPNARPAPADVRRAAQQFEAILMRQLLAPAIEPMMNGSPGGEGGAGGGGVYSYMLTDVLSNAMTQGGGLGLGKILERQMSPAAPPPSAKLP